MGEVVSASRSAMGDSIEPMKTWKIISPDKIKVGDTIKDGFDHIGVVEENMHPWGFKRLQYDGLTIINHPDPNWYKIEIETQ